jgi:hypothetical protein
MVLTWSCTWCCSNLVNWPGCLLPAAALGSQVNDLGLAVPVSPICWPFRRPSPFHFRRSYADVKTGRSVEALTRIGSMIDALGPAGGIEGGVAGGRPRGSDGLNLGRAVVGCGAITHAGRRHLPPRNQEMRVPIPRVPPRQSVTYRPAGIWSMKGDINRHPLPLGDLLSELADQLRALGRVQLMR